ncbi:beta-1,3-galactosyltransferase 5-like [Saccostrea echinata]|uniref:beta-1,3-galactosyltransferase 5-like n=1 Tax=Saccostrea echinata TaxID=191078 RepID=UPI002A7F61CB|nr:beta-1,3-galactosyltransferase 5-like [Saccostrea echinata]
MSLSRFHQFLSKGQHNKQEIEEDVLLNNSQEGVKWSRYLVKLEVETVMRKRQLSSKVLLKTSVTTVLLICLLFLTFYTIVLIFFTPSVPMDYNEWRGRHRLKLIAKIKSGNGSQRQYNQISKSGMWNVSNSVNIHLPEPRCESKLVILILICSSVQNFHQRNAIRNSWCKTNSNNKYSWHCVFLVGQAEESGKYLELTQKLEKEKDKYRDILQGSYTDTYRNLTYKVMHGLTWATAHCHSKFVLKTDDDCFVNTQLLYDLVLHHQDISSLYIGKVTNDLEKRKVIRNVENRWHVSEFDYSRDYYPPYASGAGYLMSWDTVEKFVSISPYIKPIPIEDAYVGILAEAKNIIPSNSGRFVLMSNGWTLCNYAYLVVIHGVNYQDQEGLTHRSVQATEKCLEGQSRGEMYTWN